MDEWQFEQAKKREQEERNAAIEAELSKPDRNPGEEQLIENGKVVCLDCLDPIPLKRIEIYPSAVRCVACKDVWERRNAYSKRT